MKIFSKISCIVLALVMIFSVCNISVSAGDMDAEIKYTLSKNTTESDDTFDVYDLTVSVKAGNNGIAILNIPVVYDLTKFTPSSMHKTNGKIRYTTAIGGLYTLPAITKLGEFAAEDYTFMEDGVTQDPTMETGAVMPASQASLASSVALESNLGTLDTAKYGCVYLKFTYAQDTRYIVANGEFVDVANFHFFADAGTDITGAEFGTIGDSTKPAGSVDTTGLKYMKMGNYAFGTIENMTVTNAVVAAAPSFKVAHSATQIQWANEDKNAVNLGFKGTFKMSDIGIAFDGNGKSTNVTAVGVELENGTKYDDARFVYVEGDNCYFRAVVTGIPAANYSNNIKLRYFVVYNGETLYSDWVEDNAAAHTSRLPA